MTKRCDLTGKKQQVGNNVSKSNRHTKRVFAPNLQQATFKSDLLNKVFKLKVATRTLRTITKYGSLDEYVLHTKAQNMTEFGANLKHKLMQLPEVKEKMKLEAEEKKAKRIVRPSARSLLKQKKAS